MTHLSECIALYRCDLLVTNAQYGRLIDDAIERDRLEADQAEAVDLLAHAAASTDDTGYEPSPEYVNVVESLVKATEGVFEPLTEAERDQVNSRVRSIVTATIDAVRPSPEEAAAYLLENLTSIAGTLEDLSTAIGGLIELDAKSTKRLDDLHELVEFLHNRVSLRGDEVRALNLRLDNVTTLAREAAHEAGVTLREVPR
jgi:hypothetical protein